MKLIPNHWRRRPTAQQPQRDLTTQQPQRRREEPQRRLTTQQPQRRRGTTEETDNSATTEEERGTTGETDNSATTEEERETTGETDNSATTEEERGTTEESATIEGPDSSATTRETDSSATIRETDSSRTTEGPDSSATTDDIADAEESCDFINVFNDDMFLVSRDKQQQTRQEKRDARRRYREVTSSLDVTPEEFKKLQQQDTLLGKIQLAADEELTGSGVKFFARNGLIYRRWIPQEREETEQLVVPFKCRKELLKLALCGAFREDKDNTKVATTILLARDIS